MSRRISIATKNKVFTTSSTDLLVENGDSIIVHNMIITTNTDQTGVKTQTITKGDGTTTLFVLPVGKPYEFPVKFIAGEGFGLAAAPTDGIIWVFYEGSG